MRNIAYVSTMLLFASTMTTGCFVSRKETVREVPSSTTTRIEKHSTVESVPRVTDEEVVHKRTTVDTTY
jgi:hypothetical protein